MITFITQWEYKMVQPLWKITQQFLKTLTTKLFYFLVLTKKLKYIKCLDICCCCCCVTLVLSDTVQPYRWQPTRLPRPWDSPGKNTGVGCHFLFQCRKVKTESEVAQSCLTLCDPMDCILPGSSIHGIFQARKYPGKLIIASSISCSFVVDIKMCFHFSIV